MYLPEWLPDSMHFKSATQSLFVEYTVRAYFETSSESDFDEGVSKFRGSRRVYIYQPQRPKPYVGISQKVEQNVGGVLGFMSSIS